MPKTDYPHQFTCDPNNLYIRSSEYSGTSYDPYLSVTYTQTSTSSSSTPVASVLQDLSYTYDDVGNITRLVDASDTDTQKTTVYTYDDLYRLESATVSGATDGNNGSLTYTYNAIGNITSRSDMGTYSYDGDTGSSYANPHAVTSILNADSTTTTYTYDNNGNLLSDGVKSYAWDYKNRLTSSSEETTTTTTVTTTTTTSFYAGAGDGSMYKNASTWDTAHDATSASGANSTGTVAVARSGRTASGYSLNRAFLAFDTSTLPDDATLTGITLNVYVPAVANNDNDSDDWITLVQGTQASSSTLTTDDFDTAGSINSPTEGIDTADRKDLSSITTGAYLSIPLNSVGQSWVSLTDSTKLALREGHDVLDSSYAGAASTSNALTFRTSEYTGTTYDPYLTVTYTQPTTTTTTTQTTTYAYDHAGRRVSKTSDSGTTYFPTSVYSVTDGVSTVYVTDSAGLTASIENDGTTSSTSTIHTDYLGSTSVVTDEDGIMVELLDYNPYGTERISWSSLSSDGEAESQKTYIGEYSDDESGLSYLNARYYDPERGQFLGQDPAFVSIGAFADERQLAMLLDPQLQNSYSYARGNPVSLSDASGESPLDTIAGFFVGTGKGAWGMVSDLAGMVAHPVAALQSLTSGIKAIASEPVATAEFLAQYLGDAVYDYVWNSTDYERGVTLGILAADMIGTGKKGFLDDVGRAAVRAGQLENVGGIAAKISGHAWKHADQFGGMFKNQTEMVKHIQKVIENPTKTKYLQDGRVGYYDASTQSVVIVNPNSPDQGTFFVPSRNGNPDGEHYFNNVLH